MESTESSESDPRRKMERFYRAFSAICSAVFALVGVTFLLVPDSVLVLFNDFSIPLGLPIAPVGGTGFYLILAVAYMYLVSLLAMFMFRHPDNRSYPILLINAKAASSALSLFFFIFIHPYLIALVNFIVDGAIAAAVAFLNARMNRPAS